MTTLFSGGMWALVKQADMTSTIILVLLLFLSILCWSLFIYTLIRRREQRFFITRFTRSINKSNDAALLTAPAVQENLASRYIALVGEQITAIGSVRMLDDRGWELLQQTLFQRAEQLLASQESAGTILFTSASVAPLLGLLGTVWGLVHAFMSIAITQSADITAVAPGIAEALITTIAGLLVAIPALVMYNCVVQMQIGLREAMYELADAVILLLHRTQNKGMNYDRAQTTSRAAYDE